MLNIRLGLISYVLEVRMACLRMAKNKEWFVYNYYKQGVNPCIVHNLRVFLATFFRYKNDLFNTNRASRGLLNHQLCF